MVVLGGLEGGREGLRRYFVMVVAVKGLDPRWTADGCRGSLAVGSFGLPVICITVKSPKSNWGHDEG